MGWRAVRWLILGVLAFAVVFPVAYCAVVPEALGPVATLPDVPAGKYRVYVVDWGYHTAIVVPQPPGWALGPPGEERAPFLEYAWGDRRFYMESDYWPHSVFATLVLPTASVVYLDGRDAVSSFAGARGVYSRDVDAPTLRRLMVDLERTFRRGPDGHRIPPYANRSGYRGRFYWAYGLYLWTRNCNWWTVERLRSAGLARSASGVVLSGQVAGRLRGFSELPGTGDGRRAAGSHSERSEESPSSR